jgi:NAD(P)H-flavin reductase
VGWDVFWPRAGTQTDSANAASHARTRAGGALIAPLVAVVLRAQHPGPMLCIAGGSGLAPVKSIVETALASGFAQPVHLYFGVRAERDVYSSASCRVAGPPCQFQGAHRTFRPRRNLTHGHAAAAQVWACDRCGGGGFRGLGGFNAYFAGPPPMVEAATALVKARGVGLRDIHADAFFPASVEAPKAAVAR